MLWTWWFFSMLLPRATIFCKMPFQDEALHISLIPDANCAYDLTDFVAPAEHDRDWFDPHFYHCLPLASANTLGWTLFSPYSFSVQWNGGKQRNDILVETEFADWPISWFGNGIFTIHPRFLVRTSQNTNLLIRSIPNYYKRGVVTLDGLVETDWHQGSFTLNFRLTEPYLRVHYQAGEPLAQLLVYPRNYIEQFEARVVTSGPIFETVRSDEARWSKKRKELLDKEAAQHTTQRDFSYMRGEDLDGNKFQAHQKRIHVNAFAEYPSVTVSDADHAAVENDTES